MHFYEKFQAIVQDISQKQVPIPTDRINIIVTLESKQKSAPRWIYFRSKTWDHVFIFK